MPAPLLAARITGVTIVPGIVTIATDGPVAVAHSLALSDPDRIVIDLPAVVAGQLTADGAGSVTRLRAAMFAPGIARLVIDLAAPLEIVTARASGDALVITLRRVPGAAFAGRVARGRRPLPVLTSEAAAPPPTRPSDSFDLPTTMFGAPRPRPAPTPSPPAASPPSDAAPASPPSAREAPVPDMNPAVATPPATNPPAVQPGAPAAEPLPPLTPKTRAPGVRARSGGKPLVVIDAGHGGKDVGTISVNGGYEKAVTLAIATATARLLEKSGKVRVKLTRADDRFIPLGGRVAIARAARADLFVSIHADSAPNVAARGASVYTLSAVASDAVSARLAARENKADIIGGVNLGVEAPDVGDIMIDLSRRATGNVSVAFAEILQDELQEGITFRGEFHHFAGFYVLKAPDVPSVLLETGYLSNADDSTFLFSASGRRRIAEGTARAIERHLVGDR
nr:N-acetylmuramoyl-L-alanine amidase [Polymorphobacter fuscus]